MKVDDASSYRTRSVSRRQSEIIAKLPPKRPDRLRGFIWVAIIVLAIIDAWLVLMEPEEIRGIILERRAPLPVLTEFDLRDVSGDNFLPPVRFHKTKACQPLSLVFGAFGAVEGSILYQTRLKEDLDLSESALFFCDAVRTCSKAWLPQLVTTAIETHGVKHESTFPYVADITQCPSQFTLNEVPRYWPTLASEMLEGAYAMKTWLLNHGPVFTTLTVYNDFPRLLATETFLHDQIYSYDGTSSVLYMNFGVTIVGYSDHKQAWLVRNSWGAAWNGDGYIWIKYGDASLSDYAWGFIVTNLPVSQTAVNSLSSESSKQAHISLEQNEDF